MATALWAQYADMSLEAVPCVRQTATVRAGNVHEVVL
jgi:hypothetical protein